MKFFLIILLVSTSSYSKDEYILPQDIIDARDQVIESKRKLDLAILPIGDNFTMDIEDAIIASDFVQCDKVLGYHYDTFGYIEIDHEAAIRKFFDKGKDLMLLQIGTSIEL